VREGQQRRQDLHATLRSEHELVPRRQRQHLRRLGHRARLRDVFPSFSRRLSGERRSVRAVRARRRLPGRHVLRLVVHGRALVRELRGRVQLRWSDGQKRRLPGRRLPANARRTSHVVSRRRERERPRPLPRRADDVVLDELAAARLLGAALDGGAATSEFRSRTAITRAPKGVHALSRWPRGALCLPIARGFSARHRAGVCQGRHIAASCSRKRRCRKAIEKNPIAIRDAFLYATLP
jgi:hypothetical protein